MESTDVTSFGNPTLDSATAKNTPHINIEMTTTHHSSSGSKLPDDWDAHETEHGKTYYVQRGSGLTQWEKPSSSSSWSSSASSTPQHHTRTSTQLPPDWAKHDDDQGQRYYVNNRTSESSWTAPEGASGGSVSVGGESVSSYSNPMKATKAKKAAAVPKKEHHTRTSTQLPVDWNKHNDSEGRRYYSNSQTQETSWVAPDGSTGGSTNK